MSTYMILDGNRVLWSSSSGDALEEGTAIIEAVEAGKKKGYKGSSQKTEKIGASDFPVYRP